MKHNELESIEKSIANCIMNVRHSNLVSFTLDCDKLIVLFDNKKVANIHIGSNNRYILNNYLDDYNISLIKITSDEIINSLLEIIYSLLDCYKWRLPWIIKKRRIRNEWYFKPSDQ